MGRDITTDDLLHRARSAWATKNHQLLAEAFRELDLKLSSGHVEPREWVKPLVPVTEHWDGRYEIGDTTKLAYVLHAELQEVELDYGGRMVAGRDHAAVDLDRVAHRLARRIVEEVHREREALRRLATETAYRNLQGQMMKIMPVGGSLDGS